MYTTKRFYAKTLDGIIESCRLAAGFNSDDELTLDDWPKVVNELAKLVAQMRDHVRFLDSTIREQKTFCNRLKKHVKLMANACDADDDSIKLLTVSRLLANG
jgi:hypothetical protein